MEASKGRTSILIDTDVYEQIRENIKGKGFSSVDDFVNYTLRVAIGKPSEELPKEDVEAVTARLKALGYL
jgi:Arc/MetJ-type ribon-helix-helix transcriptional regulator